MQHLKYFLVFYKNLESKNISNDAKENVRLFKEKTIYSFIQSLNLEMYKYAGGKRDNELDPS